jgi:hypothetical protein
MVSPRFVLNTVILVALINVARGSSSGCDNL